MKKRMQMVQNLNDKATVETNKPSIGDASTGNKNEQQTEGDNNKRVHWSGTHLQGH